MKNMKTIQQQVTTATVAATYPPKTSVCSIQRRGKSTESVTTGPDSKKKNDDNHRSSSHQNWYPFKREMLKDTLVLEKTDKDGTEHYVTSIGPEDTRKPCSRSNIDKIAAMNAKIAARKAEIAAKNWAIS